MGRHPFRWLAAVPVLPLVQLVACSSGMDPSASGDGPIDTGVEHGDISGTLATTDSDGESEIGESVTTSGANDGSSSGDVDDTTGNASNGDTDGLTDGSSDGTTDAPTAECNNGVVEGQEQCDSGDLAGKTCKDEGFGGGGLLCNDDCTFDTSNCTPCGNNVWDVEAGEECDGMDLGEFTTCYDLGLGQMTEMLGCTSNCTHDYSMCSGCGDGNLMAPEACEPSPMPPDPPNLDGQTCEGLGYDGGDLQCSAGCAFDTTDCYTCGDGTKNGLEQCDGGDFGGLSCLDFPSQTGPNFTGGSLSCVVDTCTIATDNCKYCGDALITADETCDGANLNSQTCQTLGSDDGTLACSDACTFDTSACTDCGDGTAEGAEQCDGADKKGATCTSLGFVNGGTLNCNASCSFDTSMCMGATCGDSVISTPEKCDCGAMGSPCTAPELANKACTDLASPLGSNYTGGTLSCFSPSNCDYDKSDCWYCGNNDQEGSEVCDGTDLPITQCSGLGTGYSSGTLSCNASCQYNTSGCSTLTTITTVLNTAAFSHSSLTKHGIETGILAIMIPSDLTSLSLKIDPNGTADRIAVTLKDGATTLASCTTAAAGELCNLGNSINMTGHNGKVVIASVTHMTGTYLNDTFTVTISGNTAGLSSNMSHTGTWRSSFTTPGDFVLWPVGTAAAPNFSYGWSDTAPDSAFGYDVGVLSPTGVKYDQTGVDIPAFASWPNTVPAGGGWYLFSTATFHVGGSSYTLTIQP